MYIKSVHDNHIRVSKGEKLTIEMLNIELNECIHELTKQISNKDKLILEKHISTLKFLIKTKKNNIT